MSQIQDDSWRFPMPLMCSAFESGMLDYTLAQMPKDGFGAIAHAEAFYYRGLPDDACRLAEPYLTSEDLSLRLSACLICAYANLSLNRSMAARRCLKYLEETGKDPRVTENPRARASYMLFAASACVLLHFSGTASAAHTDVFDGTTETICRAASRGLAPVCDVCAGASLLP